MSMGIEGESMFERILGDSPAIRVLELLLTSREMDYSKKDIAEGAEISWNTLAAIWPRLDYNGLIVKTRKIGKQDMYKLNTENKYVKDMVKLFDSLIKHSIEEAQAKISVVQMAK